MAIKNFSAMSLQKGKKNGSLFSNKLQATQNVTWKQLGGFLPAEGEGSRIVRPHVLLINYPVRIGVIPCPLGT
jgi:hypothetical protein